MGNRGLCNFVFRLTTSPEYFMFFDVFFFLFLFFASVTVCSFVCFFVFFLNKNKLTRDQLLAQSECFIFFNLIINYFFSSFTVSSFLFLCLSIFLTRIEIGFLPSLNISCSLTWSFSSSFLLSLCVPFCFFVCLFLCLSDKIEIGFLPSLNISGPIAILQLTPSLLFRLGEYVSVKSLQLALFILSWKIKSSYSLLTSQYHPSPHDHHHHHHQQQQHYHPHDHHHDPHYHPHEKERSKSGRKTGRSEANDPCIKIDIDCCLYQVVMMMMMISVLNKYVLWGISAFFLKKWIFLLNEYSMHVLARATSTLCISGAQLHFMYISPPAKPRQIGIQSSFYIS